MGTPFVAFLGPSDLSGYNRKLPPSSQPPSVPKVFLDAMEVRKKVFVQEQRIPIENEFDADDDRACHWVVYASINTTNQPEVTSQDGTVTQRKQSTTQTLPIGTIRLVPFPQPPHPQPNGHYIADALETSSSSPTTTSPPPYTPDRSTTFHDGTEPYIKLGRLAVLPEFRGVGIAKLLVNSALTWASENPTYFSPSVKEVGLSNISAPSGEIPIWLGLVCVHAQVQVAKTWGKWGFEVDEGMGRWWEENIEHVGMFRRVAISKKQSIV